MNPFVDSPDWGWWIIFYFFLGGMAAGAYFTATLIDLAAGERGARLARLGYTVALPLIALCGVLLTLDLGQPPRFWHMLLKSEKVKEAFAEGWPFAGWGSMGSALLFKRWSPMSVGSWGLSLFGLCSALSLLGAWRPEGVWTRWLHRGVLARLLRVAGCLAGFFVAAYTGTLLSATNQPLWSDTQWLAPLFLTSAASTGISLMLLLSRRRGVPADEADGQLERADLWVLALESLVFAGFLASVGGYLGLVWDTFNGKLLIAATPFVGIILPVALHLAARLRGNGRNHENGHEVYPRGSIIAASLLSLAGGFLLRYSILHTAPEMLANPEAILRVSEPATVGTATPFLSNVLEVSPEDGRPDGGGPGADPGNHGPDLLPRSKLPQEKASQQDGSSP
jgi:formate-dependent nitrite reductase membrane component NrfD